MRVDGQHLGQNGEAPLRRIANVDVDALCEGAIDEVTDHARKALDALIRDYRFALKKRGNGDGRVSSRRANEAEIAALEEHIRFLCEGFSDDIRMVDLGQIRREIGMEMSESAALALDRATRPEVLRGVRVRTGPEPEPVLDKAARLGVLRRVRVRTAPKSEPEPMAPDDDDGEEAVAKTIARGQPVRAVSRRRPKLKSEPGPELEEEDEVEEEPEFPSEVLSSDNDCAIAELHIMLLRHGAADDSALHAYAEVLATAEDKILRPYIFISRFPALNSMKSVDTIRLFIYNLHVLFQNASGLCDFDAETCGEAESILAGRAKGCGIDPERVFRGKRNRFGGFPGEILGSSDDGAGAAETPLRNMLRGMLKTPNFWRMLSLSIKKDLAADMQAEDEKAREEGRPSQSTQIEELVKGLYVLFLKRLSAKLHERKIRKNSEVLHPQLIGGEDVAKFTTMIDKEELPANLWKQQSQGLRAVAKGFEKGEQYVYVDVPPGTGKTRILLLAAQCLNSSGNSVLLVPNLHLVEQHRRQAKQHGINLPTGIVSPHDAIVDQPLTIMTYQQMEAYLRQGLFKSDRFNLLLFDELHDTRGDARQEIIRAFPAAKVVGATATSDGIDPMFKCVYRISLMDGLRAGICNPIQIHNIELPDFSLDDPDSEQKDLSQRQLEILEWYRQNCEGRQVLIIMSNNERAEAMAEYFKERGGIKDASAIHGGVGSADIFRMNEEFHAGKLKVLVTSEFIVQGWDCSGLRNLVLGDCPEHEWQAAQRIGRAIRQVTVSQTDSRILQLRGGLLRKRHPGAGVQLIHAPKPTALDNLFKIPSGFVSGSRIIEPEFGFWPRNPFKV